MWFKIIIENILFEIEILLRQPINSLLRSNRTDFFHLTVNNYMIKSKYVSLKVKINIDPLYLIIKE